MAIFNNDHIVIISIFTIVMVALAIYMLIAARSNTQDSPHAPPTHNFIPGNPIHVYILNIHSIHDRVLTCQTNAAFSKAHRQGAISTIVIGGYTYNIASVSYSRPNEMQIRLTNQPNGIYKVNTAIAALPNAPTTAHVFAY